MRKIKLHKEKEFKPISPEESKQYMDFNKVIGHKDLYQFEQMRKPLYKKPMFLGFVIVVAVVLLVSIWEEEHPENSKKSEEIPTKIESPPKDSTVSKDTAISSVYTPPSSATIRPINAANNIENNSNANFTNPQEGVISISECSFPGGQNELDKFIKNKLKYPYNAIDRPLTEYVQVELTIDTTGKAIIKKIGQTNQAFEVEIKNLVTQMPKWSPKKINQKSVPSDYSITVPFIYQSHD
ncbi:MAG: hypothetical protein U0U66_01750 [Cytophagaceae bacterium]